MGVQGLWQLLQSTGKPVSLQTLEGKVLAVDVSIWLHQALKGMRDKDGNPLPNAHLQVLFSRICKLLFYKIKPIFVFDGGVPELKKHTMIARRERKEFAEKESSKMNKKFIENMLRKHAIKEVLGDDSTPKYNISKKKVSDDVFQLPPLPASFKREQEEMLSEEMEGDNYGKNMHTDLSVSDDVDVESKDFKSLPKELQHEILMDLIERKKMNSWATMHELPKESDDFSSFQMSKILKKNKLSSRLDEVRKEMNEAAHADLTSNIREEYFEDAVVQTSRVVSDDSTHFVLIKGLSKKQQEEEIAKAQQFQEDKMLQNALSMYEGSGTSEASSEDQLLKESDEDEKKMEKLEKINWISTSETETTNKSMPNNTSVNNKKKQISKEHITLTINTDSDDNEDEGEEDNSIMVVEDTPMLKTASFIPDPNTSQNRTLDGSESDPDLLKAIQASMDDVSNRRHKVIKDSFEEGTSDEISAMATKSVKPQPSKSEYFKRKNKRAETGITFADEKNEDVTERNLGNSDTDDEGFIEITVDTQNSKVDDELFPASIFTSNASKSGASALDKKISTENHSNEKPPSPQPGPSKSSPSSHSLVSSPIKLSPSKLKTNLLSEQFLKSNDYEFVAKEHITGLSASLVNNTQDDDSETIEDREAEAEFLNSVKHLQGADLTEFEEELAYESASLQQERAKQERLALTVTDQMYAEAQELLRLFGLPFLISPMEAEAQCAFLDASGQCQGSITDDSDIWLFGGRRVYKNFFNQDKHVEFFKEDNISSQLGLTRDQLICIALLCGSDYTLGIQGVGPVTALEIMGEFAGNGVQALKSFKDYDVTCSFDDRVRETCMTYANSYHENLCETDPWCTIQWWDKAHNEAKVLGEQKLRTKLRKLDVHQGFPSETVVEAYINPEIDTSKEPFTWSSPDLDLLRMFSREKFGWKKERCDELLLPVLKQLNSKQFQGRIDSYFQPEQFLEPKKLKSSRIKEALNKINNVQDQETDEPPNSETENKVSLSKVPVTAPQARTAESKEGAKRGSRGRGAKRISKPSRPTKKAVINIRDRVDLSESSSSDEAGGDGGKNSCKKHIPNKKTRMEGEECVSEDSLEGMDSHMDGLSQGFSLEGMQDIDKVSASSSRGGLSQGKGRRGKQPKPASCRRGRYSAKSLSSAMRLPSQTEMNKRVKKK